MPRSHPAVYLCANPRHLFLAAADSLSNGQKDTIIYLEDIVPLADETRSRLAQLLAQVRFVITSDQAEQQAFANLPASLPAILRRNLRLSCKTGLRTVHSWPPAALGQQKFNSAFLYHSGLFTAKSVATCSQTVTLREDGLNNYQTFPIKGPKAGLRALSGMRPFTQVWGEERWIDRIEATHPQRLPKRIAHKATAFSTTDHFKGLSAPVLAKLAQAFTHGATWVPPHDNHPHALLLTQPLSEVGICSETQKKALFTHIAQRLQSAGYIVHVKPHPREETSLFPADIELPRHIPLEAWYGLDTQKYDLAIALRSFALAETSDHIAKRTQQLVPQSLFNQAHFKDWPGIIDTELASITSPSSQ